MQGVIFAGGRSVCSSPGAWRQSTEAAPSRGEVYSSACSLSEGLGGQSDMDSQQLRQLGLVSVKIACSSIVNGVGFHDGDEGCWGLPTLLCPHGRRLHSGDPSWC